MSGSSMQEKLAQYPLLEALTRRRSRRFGLGMETKRGRSRFAVVMRRLRCQKRKRRCSCLPPAALPVTPCSI